MSENRLFVTSVPLPATLEARKSGEKIRIVISTVVPVRP